MPLTAQHKQQSRERILTNAIALFAQQGFDGVSIDQVMERAGMTRGAFYAHFKSKSELYQYAIAEGVKGSVLLEKCPEGIEPIEWLATLLKRYLSREHLAQENGSCPLACLATDVAIRDDAVRETYTAIYQGMNQVLLDHTDSHAGFDRQQGLALSAMMIGGIAVSRAVNDPKLVDEVLAACQNLGQQMLKS